MKDPRATLFAQDCSSNVISLFRVACYSVKSGIILFFAKLFQQIQLQQYHQLLIHKKIIMFKTALKTALILTKNTKFLQQIVQKTRFCLTESVKFPATSMKTIVEQEIADEEGNIEDLSEFENFFRNQGWIINYRDTQIELEKLNGQHDVRILVKAKAPTSEQSQGEEQESMSTNYTDIAFYVKKQGTKKWLACEFMVSGNDASLAMTTFIEDYEKDRADKATNRYPDTEYNGPDFASLEENLQQAIYAFIQEMGVSGEILQKVAEFSLAYEHKFYLEWLKDLKSLT